MHAENRATPAPTPRRGRRVLMAAAVVTLAATALLSCAKSDSDGGSGTTAAPTTAAPTTEPAEVTTTAASADGKPSFTSFEVSSSVPCQGGNATATMSFETKNVESIEISIGGGAFASTAGYGPNESDVVASIPCSGATTSSIQLKGCNGEDVCATSDKKTVEVTAS